MRPGHTRRRKSGEDIRDLSKGEVGEARIMEEMRYV
jgi:hypothetical protein